MQFPMQSGWLLSSPYLLCHTVQDQTASRFRSVDKIMTDSFGFFYGSERRLNDYFIESSLSNRAGRGFPNSRSPPSWRVRMMLEYKTIRFMLQQCF